MRRLLVALLVAAPLLHAQPLTFGDPFALTNTRYGPAWGFPLIESNGKDFFVFWRTLTNLRATRLVEGEPRAGRHVIPIDNPSDHMAVTWTGTHFLVLLRSGHGVAVQLLDANAEPVGGELPIAPFSLVGAAASNGQAVLVLHWTSGSVEAEALTLAGEPTGVRSTVVTPGAGAGFSALTSNGTGYAAVVSTDSGTVAVMFDAQGREQSRTSLFTGTFPQMAGSVSIESNGRDYLAAWQLWNGTVQAAHVRADGTAGPVFTIDVPAPDRSGASPLDVAWTGANWAVAYTIDAATPDHALRVAYVRPALPQVSGIENAGHGAGPSLAAAADGRVMLIWSPSGGSNAPPVMASLLPLAGREPEPVTFAAGDQELAAVASTADATLVVWNESGNGGTSLRAGVRSADGDWREREVFPQSSFDTLAATDGHDFVVVAQPGAASAIFLDATSRVTAGPVPLPLRPWAIAWTGTDYLITELFSIARLSRSGSVSTPVPTGNYAFLALASNGSAVMAVMMEPEQCPILCPGIFGRPRFARLGPDLLPIGEPRLVVPGDLIVNDAQVVWDGERFVTALVGDRIYIAELPLDGGVARLLATIESAVVSRLRMAVVEGGVALAWRESVGQPASRRTRVAVIGHDDGIRTAVVDDGGHPSTRDAFVTALPNGSLGLFETTPQFAPPHHGNTRVMMRVAGAALPQKPDAPRLTGRVRDGRVELAWTAPPQPVAGYRIEYRIGNGAWNEINEWFDANDHEIAIAWELRPGIAYQFRIRAFNDAGTSDYSSPVLLNVSRRRAVR